MVFQEIEGSWPRQEHFGHYLNNTRCTYSLTVQIDITKLRGAWKAGGYRAYPVQIYLLAATVNGFPEFRMGLSEAGAPGYWDILHPAYTVFHGDTKTFSSIWTLFDQDFAEFYPSCTRDMARYSQAAAFAPKAGRPPGSFDISSVPWVDFTAFNLNVYAEGTHLSPIFTIGQYVEQGGRTFMPLALQLHHAACDGYHAGQFIASLRDMAAECHRWL